MAVVQAVIEPRTSWSLYENKAPLRQGGSYRGAAVHWPGDDIATQGEPHSNCLTLLRAIEHYQVSSAGYSAIAYQYVACPHGKVIEGRGAKHKNGANGKPDGQYDPNVPYGSILALIGMKEHPTDELLSAVLAARKPLGVVKLYTHNDVRPEPTACPGPDLTKWVHDGYHAPEDPDMPLSDQDIQKVADAVWSKLVEDPVQKDKVSYGTLLRRVRLLLPKG